MGNVIGQVSGPAVGGVGTASPGGGSSVPSVHTFPAGSLPKRRSNRPQQRRYLVGVQGLRTVAAILVAIYHIWFGRVSGGVDVFFVVAGFFAVGSLTRAFARDGGVLGALRTGINYLVRTLRRIVPSAVVVIFATIIMSLAWMPSAYWSDNLGDSKASLLFVENWQLVSRGADYLQQDLAASPFQQFWALGVNAQFYLFIAVLLTITAVVARHLRASETTFRHVLIGVLTVVLIGSLIYSIVFTAENQQAAYFSTFTRLWEFMVGALAYLLIREGIASKWLSSLLGWLGLAVLLGLGAVADLSQLLPGWLSIIPVSAALAIIISSWNGNEPIVLKAKPVLWIADSSFALYLWHWPLLVFYRYQFGYEVSFVAGVGIILASLVLAVITTKLIEDPIRKWSLLAKSNWLSVLACLVLMLPPLGALAYWSSHTDSVRNSVADVSEDFESSDPNSLIPHPAVARDDIVTGYQLGCHQRVNDPAVLSCEVGAPDASKTIAVVGGSHSLQWMDVVVAAAVKNDARVVVSTKSNCLFADVPGLGFEVDESCGPWNEQVLENLLEMDPDLVVTIGTRSIEGVEQVPEGYLTRFKQLAEAAIPVLAIRDNPWFEFDPPACVETSAFEECSIAAEEFYAPIAELELPTYESFHFVDLEPLLCEGGRCPVVQGNILVYRDYNHLTTTWTLHNAAVVEDVITDVLSGAK